MQTAIRKKLVQLGMVALFVISPLAVAKAADEVKIGYVTRPSLSIAPITLALDRGYWKEEGIDAEIIQLEGAGALIPQMLAKRVTVGYPNPDALIIGKQPGMDPLPIKFFYNVSRKNIWEIAVKPDSGIETLEDLRGKKIGVGSLNWGNLIFTKGMLVEAGLEEGSYELVPVGLGGAAFLAFNRGDVDALNLFDTQHAQLEKLGTKIRRLVWPDKYLNLMSNGWIAHEDTLAENPDLLVRYARGFAKATVACGANREACVRSFWNVYPSLKPTDKSDEEAMANALSILDARYDKFQFFPKGYEDMYGVYPEGSIQSFINVLFESGLIKSPDVDPNDVFTNELIEKINDFDHAAVAAAAKSQN